ncbi:hypothetical protein HS125_08895 [bacterium]|nr:hypothetical protein [bacterium]
MQVVTGAAKDVGMERVRLKAQKCLNIKMLFRSYGDQSWAAFALIKGIPMKAVKFIFINALECILKGLEGRLEECVSEVVV